MDFDTWMARQRAPEPAAAPAPEQQPIQAKCSGCGRIFEVDYVDTQEEADSMPHHCGADPRCCP